MPLGYNVDFRPTTPVGFLSLVGVPPLAGFTVKVLLFAATVDAGYTWLAVLAMAN